MPSNASLFATINPYTVKELPEEEKPIAEKMLIEALKDRIDRRWLYGIEELKSKKGYSFLLELFNKEKDIFNKTMIAGTLIRMNREAPVLDFMIKVIESEESEGTKLKALEGLYWLVEHKSKDKNRNKKFLSMLYNAMTFPKIKIRKNAYSKLKEYYKMRNFTPNNDSIEKTIEGEHVGEEYQKAVQEFKIRVDSKETFPFSLEKVSEFIDNLPDNVPKLEISECEICNTIPDSSSADIAAGNSLDKYKIKLETTIIIAYYENCVMRCPICGGLYDYNYHYEYYACSTNDEDEYLTRIDRKKAKTKIRKFVKSYEFKKIITCKNFLKIDY